MKIAICLPALRLSGIYFWIDLMDLIINLMSKKHIVRFFFNESSMPLDLKRETLAQQALDYNPDYILWLDMDMRFGPDLFDRLVKWNKDIVSGIYIDRYGNIICKTKGQKPIPIKRLKKGRLIKIESTGFGCLLVKGSVFKHLKTPWFEWHMGRPEDLDWCYKVLEQGYDIYCDPNTFVGHGFAERNRYLRLK